MTDPRPAEGPDREALGWTVEHERTALRDVLAQWEAERDRDPVDYMHGASRAILALRAALLPSPPAPGGGHRSTCGRIHPHEAHLEGGLVPCPGEPSPPAPGGEPETHGPIHRFLTGRHHDEPAPGGGDTDLRAEAIAADLLGTDALTPNHDGTPEHYIVDAENVAYLVRTVLALAARPDADRAAADDGPGWRIGDEGCRHGAPGGGDTDLRAAVEAAIYADAEGVDPDERQTVVDAVVAVVAHQRDRAYQEGREDGADETTLAAALAARPDADRDALARVEALHRPFTIYDQCSHEHTEADVESGVAVDIDDVGYVCPEGVLYVACRACCTQNGEQTEDCATYHDHADGFQCATIAALSRDTAEGGS